MVQETYTLSEAAEVLRCDEQTLRRAIKAGTLRAARIGRNYVVGRPDLAAFYAAKGGGQLFDPDAQG